MDSFHIRLYNLNEKEKVFSPLGFFEGVFWVVAENWEFNKF